MKGMRSVKRGKWFRGVLNYVFGRDDEHKSEPGKLIGGNLSGTDPRTLAQEFGITRRLRPEIEKPVWHNSLRLPKNESVADDQWLRIADEYMQEMGFTDLHPRCYVLHNDKDGQHIHIVASRIALDGSLYLGKNENLASTRIIQELEIEHMLTITKGPEYESKTGPDDENKKIKMPAVKAPKKNEIEKGLRLGIKPPRLVLQGLIDETTKEPRHVMQFVEFMEANGVSVVPNLASTGKLNGFSFSYDGVSFKGSSLGDKYKWAKLAEVVDYDKARDFAELAKLKRSDRKAGENNGRAGNIASTDAGLDERGPKFTETESRDAGADSKVDVEVLASGSIDNNSIVNRGADADATVKPSWNSRFKIKSAKRRAKQDSSDMQAKYQQVRDDAHMADLVAYMESVGLEVKKDGVKDWIIDERYCVTQKPDGHFVWCTWDQSRGGDGIAFLRDEMGLTFEQAVADLSGSSITHKTKRNVMSCDEPISPPPRSKDRDAITAYLESRGISKKTVGLAHGKEFLKFVDYKGIPSAAFCGNVDGALRSMAIRLIQPVQSFDGEKELTKLDVRHSDKSYPAIWKGDNPPSTVWIVEGGIDALAAVEWHRASKKPIPTIIVSGGAGVRSFLDRPHVQNLLKEADTVYVAMEQEKNEEIQAKTDAAHQKQIDKLCELGCEKVIPWMPPAGSKDIADAWKAGVLPDPHDGSYDQQVSDNSDDVLMLPNEMAEAVEAMAPVMRDD